MQFDELIGQVQRRTGLESRRDAERAARAVLETLAERLDSGTVDNLAAQLPGNLGRCLTAAEDHFERMSLDEFCTRVGERENVDPPAAAHHARCVLDVVGDATQGVVGDLEQELPEEWRELLYAGSAR